MSAGPRWLPTAAAPIGAVAAFACAVAGLLASRPDVVVLGLPLALWVLWATRRPAAPSGSRLRYATRVADATATTTFTATQPQPRSADAVQVAIELPDRRVRDVVLPAAGGMFHAHSRLLHSGPAQLAGVTTRVVASDGAAISEPDRRIDVGWDAAPNSRALDTLPLPLRLTGLHGSHQGTRAGQGGDFRDIHPFAPGDELRRVDWRTTARLSRRPDDLYVRRMLTLSDMSVVIVMDTTANLGEAVASWGTTAPDVSGVTSLDLTREAARSIAEAAIAAGDRVALHELSVGGRAMRAGAGPRHLARIVGVLAALAERDAPIDPTRLPPVLQGALVCVLSPFFDGAAVRAALAWRACGRTVLAVDTLPTPDQARLSTEQRIAARILLDEREDAFADLTRAGVGVVRWAEGADATATAVLRASRRRP